jgi:glycosyltransferase involved in cell wall biosynthesis
MQEMPPNAVSVSIVMCTYNGAKFIEEQLLSILNQTYPLKEVLIFDDASTDNTVEIIERIATDHSNIILKVNEQNLGYTRNFEQALLAATGDVIAISDQDDVWLPQKIEKMVKAWMPNVPLIYCSSFMFQGQVPINPKPYAKFRRFEGTDARKLFLYNTVSGHALMIRRSFLALAMPLSSNVTYDWWMAVVACYNGGVQYLPEVLVCQRFHNDNVTIHKKDKYSKQEIRDQLKQTIINNCTLFATAPGITLADKKFALRMAGLAAESLHHSFYAPLFLFLFRYRRILFNYKVRKFGFFSHFKHSYRRTIR